MKASASALVLLLASSFALAPVFPSAAEEPASPPFSLPARWQYSAPLIAPEARDAEPSRAQKDPTVVFHDGRWHVFMTVKLEGRSAIEYCAFADWDGTGDKTPNAAERHLLPLSDSRYFCAPQVFWFEPHQLWYLVYQLAMPKPEGAKFPNKMWVAYSTTADIGDPTSWTEAQPMPGLDGGPDDPRTVGGLDYWIICDEERAHLFLTSLNGKLWRLSTAIQDFPAGFGNCQLALQADIFEASHTYRVPARAEGDYDRYLTLIEAKAGSRRYFKAWVADRLDGEWRPLADRDRQPFAGVHNTEPAPGVEAWTDNISHGELLRAGIDQTLTIDRDPANLRFLFQGMRQKDMQGKGYGAFQWRLGLLTPEA